MSAEANKEHIRRYVRDVLNGGDLGALDRYVARDAVAYSSNVPEGTSMAGVVAMVRTAFPDLQVREDDLIAEGDRVVVRMTWRGTHRGPLYDIPPTGKQATFPMIAIYRLSEGKIAELHYQADMLGLLQQVGVIPAPGQGRAADPVALVQAFDAAWNAHDVDDILAFFAEEATVRLAPPLPGAPEISTGREQIRAFVRAFVSGFQVESSGHTVRGTSVGWRSRVSADAFRALGVDSTECSVEATVRDGRIAGFTVSFTPETLARLQAASQAAR